MKLNLRGILQRGGRRRGAAPSSHEEDAPTGPVAADSAGTRNDDAKAVGVPGRLRALVARVPRGALVASAAVAAALIASGGLIASSRPGACATCHAPQAEALERSVHVAVDCYDCHLAQGWWSIVEAKGSELFRMYPAALVSTKLTGPGVRISRSACAKCHGGGPPGVLETKGIRIQHSTCTPEPGRCDGCHGGTAHGDAVRWLRAPVMDDCVTCHNESKASVACDTCHDGKLQTERLESGPWQVTHGQNWESTHGMGDLSTCITCHPKEKCIKCHHVEVPHTRNFLATHGQSALSDDSACFDCHRTEDWCASCHGLPMPHPTDFLPTHSTEASSTADPVCTRCHAVSDCKNCHVAHTHPGRTDGRLRAILPRIGEGEQQ